MSSSAANTLRITVATMLLVAAAAPVDAQDSTRTLGTPDSLASSYRDPRTAQLLGSFIPGAGHLYAGEKLRGLGLGAAALIGTGTGIVFLTRPDCPGLSFSGERCGSSALAGNRINGITQIAGGIAAWVFGAIDAPRAATRENERARHRVAVTPFLRDDVVRQPALGVAVTVRW